MTFEAVKRQACCLPASGCDCPFPGDFVSTVLRHTDTGKWFGLLMEIDGRHVGRNGRAQVLNCKVDPGLSALLQEKHPWILPSYHMNKRLWVSVVLAEAEEEVVGKLIEHSYALTAKGKKKKI